MARKTPLLWAALTALALLVHFFVTPHVAVPVLYFAAGLYLVIALEFHARRRLARAAHITDARKIAAIEFAVDGLPLPPEAEREFLQARRVSALLFFGTFAAGVVMFRLTRP